METILRPFRAATRGALANHGFRDFRLSANIAPLVAILLDPYRGPEPSAGSITDPGDARARLPDGGFVHHQGDEQERKIHD